MGAPTANFFVQGSSHCDSLHAMKYRNSIGIMLVAVVFPMSTQAAFSDVSTLHPNVDAIEYVQHEGVVSGYPDGTYKPNNTINRAELVKIIVNARFTQEEIRQCDFEKDIGRLYTDVDLNAWYAPFVCKASMYNFIKGQKGEAVGRHTIVNGYPDGTFKPEQLVNFVEAAKIIALGYFSYPDGHTTWYRPFVELLETKKAIPITISAFDSPLTRGEMAEIIYRLQTENESKDSLTFSSLDKEAGGGNQESNVQLIELGIAPEKGRYKDLSADYSQMVRVTSNITKEEYLRLLEEEIEKKGESEAYHIMLELDEKLKSEIEIQLFLNEKLYKTFHTELDFEFVGNHLLLETPDSQYLVVNGKEISVVQESIDESLALPAEDVGYIVRTYNEDRVYLGAENPKSVYRNYKGYAFFNKDKTQFAFYFQDKNGLWNMYVNHERSGPFRSITYGGGFIDDTTIAYPIQDQTSQYATRIENIYTHESYDLPARYISFSANGKYVAYKQENGDGSVTMVVAQQGKNVREITIPSEPLHLFDGVSLDDVKIPRFSISHPIVSNNGQMGFIVHLEYYKGWSRSHAVVMIDEEKHGQFNEVHKLQYLSDGTPVYLAVEHIESGNHVESPQYLIVGDKKSNAFYEITNLLISSKSDEILFAASKNFGALQLHRNNVVGNTYYTISHLSYSPDNNHVVFVGQQGRDSSSVKRFAVVDGKAGPAFDGVWTPFFTEDSSHVIYAASKDGKIYRVVQPVHQ
jgi:hypothetical protein